MIMGTGINDFGVHIKHYWEQPLGICILSWATLMEMFLSVPMDVYWHDRLKYMYVCVCVYT